MNLNELIQDEELQLKKLHELVEQSINEEMLLSTKLAELESDGNLSLGQRWADKVAEFGGSWKFIGTFFTVLVVWIFLNSIQWFQPFDPYPYILLNLILSCVAALQAPVIMMSQNRQEEKDRRRSRSDFLVNLKAEMEVSSLHKKMDLLMAEQMQHLFKIQQIQLNLLQQLDEKINKK